MREFNSIEIKPNVYWVEKGTERMLYAPFKGVVARGAGAYAAKALIRFVPDKQKSLPVLPLPTTVTLDLTHACPLGCIYCSVDSGRDVCVLELQTAFSAIDRVFNNAAILNAPNVGVVFGGGGEPTQAWEVLKRCIEYSQIQSSRTGTKLQILLATGGIISKEKAIWLANQVSHIALSFDGLEKVQNSHRPLKNGDPSHFHVTRTLEILSSVKADFSIRAAISEQNINLVELVEYCAQYHPRFINLQPIVICGRCLKTGCKSVDANAFIEAFKKARNLGLKLGVPLLFPGTKIQRLIPEMCHAYNGTGFVITNRGLVSACERVVEENDPLARIFMFGNYRDGNLVIDKQKHDYLRTLKIDNVPGCVNCFCRWHCCGGCLNDHLSQPENQGNPFTDRATSMCKITKELVWFQLKEAIN